MLKSRLLQASRPALFISASLGLCALSGAQEDAPPPPPAGESADEKKKREDIATPPGLDLGTLVVTPTARKQSILDVPYTVDRITEDRLRFRRTLPEALQDVPGVLPQATGTAQGSPYIRGFTGFRTLLLVDGIRVNNSVFREGPNQYAGTIDPLALSGIEVVKGPSSVLYGSDAIGGTISSFTKSPRIWDRPIGGEIFTRYAAGANYLNTRLELGGAIDEKTAWHLGGTLKNFNDVRSGGGTLPDTGYDQGDVDLKLQHRIDDLTTLTFAANRTEIDDAPRTHRTIFAVPFAGSTVGSDLRRDFNQIRTLAYARLDTAAGADGDWETQTTLSYQRQQERRNRERTGDRFDAQGFDVETTALQLRAGRETSLGFLTVGGEWYHDNVNSFLNRFDDQTAADNIQGPIADDSTYDLAGLYAELAYDIFDHTTLTAGVRGTYAAVDANEVRDPVDDSQFSLDDDYAEVTGSLRFESRLLETKGAVLALFGGVSQGFRAPNLSDLTRFDSARTNEFEVPSPGLDPEDFIAYELGLKHETGDLSVQLSAFLTYGDNVIQRFPTGNINADGEVEITRDNVGQQTIGGAEIGMAYNLTDEWTVFGNAAFLDGQEETRGVAGGDIIEAAPSRLMPFTSQLGLRYEPLGSPWSFEARWLHANDADRLSPRDQTDDSRIPPGGTPGYDVVTLWSQYQVTKAFTLTAALENIGDVNYRVHGSGQNQPGINAIFSARFTF